jgi:dipeptidyl aminopeptidase/acylaminoacyl peptidase
MKRMARLMMTCLVCCILAQPVLAHEAQRELRPLSVEDALSQRDFPPFSPISLSPDGHWVAYTLETRLRKQTTLGTKYHYFSPTGVGRPAEGGRVWLTNLATGETISLAPAGKTSSWAPVWSPDGKRLAYYSDEGGVSHLWIWDRAAKKAHQAGDAIIRAFTSLEVPKWTPDSKRIVSRILPYGTTIEDGEKAIAVFLHESQAAEKDDKVTVTVFDSAKSQERVSGLDTVSAYVADLAVIQADTGQVKTIARGFSPMDYWISPNGENVAFVDFRGMDSNDNRQVNFDILVAPLISDGKARVVAKAVPEPYVIYPNVSWSPDSQFLSYVTWAAKGGDCIIIPINAGGPRRAAKGNSPNFGNYFRPPLWDSTGESLYLLATDGTLWKVSVAEGRLHEVARVPGRVVLDIVYQLGKGTFWSPDGERSLVLNTRNETTKEVGFYKVDLINGRVSKLVEESKDYGAPLLKYSRDMSADGQTIVYLQQDTDHNFDIWTAGGNLDDRRQVTKSNPQFEQYQFGQTRLIEWRSLDGIDLKGTLLLPAGYKPGQRYPMIVYPYPTDLRSNYLNRFGVNGTGTENMQVFATRGYAVFLPDNVIREGSTMRDLAKSILPGVDKVVEMGVADNDRIGIIGHSWGGYTVLSLIVQTTRFKAAIMRGGHGNLISLYGAMENNGSSRGQLLFDAGAGAHGMGGTPWQVRDRYIENSPVFYLDKIETPLLIIHGGSERTVPVHLANEIFVDLRRLGKKVVYARYDGEIHGEGNWGYANQVDYLNRVIEWFDSRLKPSGTTPKASQ